MVPLLVTHAEDPDGIIARALLMRQFPAGQKHVFVRYDRLVEAFEEAALKARECSSVYVADVNPNPRLISADGSGFTLLEKIAKDREMYWFDHHDATLKHKDKMESLGIKVHHHEKQCAALILAQHYCRSDPYEKRLAKIAQAHDHKNDSVDHPNIRIGDELEKVIAVANEKLNYGLLSELCFDLSKEKCFDAKFQLTQRWQRYASDFDIRAPLAYRDLNKNIEIFTLGSYRILVGYCPALLSKKGLSHLLKNYGHQADVFISLFSPPARNHLLVTHEKSSFQAVSFVQSLGGGGRGAGGGFTLDYDISPQNYQQVKEMLLAQIEKYSK